MYIDKDVPPPSGRLSRLQAQDVLFAMSNHDSVFMAGVRPNSSPVQAFRKAAKMSRIHIVTRAENSGVRIWRLSPLPEQYLQNIKADGGAGYGTYKTPQSKPRTD